MVKIGMTSRDPSTRTAEITSSSGLVAPASVYCCVRVPDRRAAEQEVHASLRRFRVRKGRELFRVTPEYAASVLSGLNGSQAFAVARRHPRTRSAFYRRSRDRMPYLLLGVATLILGALWLWQ